RQDLDMRGSNSIVLSLQIVIGASDIPVHHSLPSRSFLTNTLSWLKSPDFQSARSPFSMVMRAVIRQQSSVLSEKRMWMYRKPSSNSCSTQSMTFPRKPRYWRPGRGLGEPSGADLGPFIYGLPWRLGSPPFVRAVESSRKNATAP